MNYIKWLETKIEFLEENWVKYIYEFYAYINENILKEFREFLIDEFPLHMSDLYREQGQTYYDIHIQIYNYNQNIAYKIGEKIRNKIKDLEIRLKDNLGTNYNICDKYFETNIKLEKITSYEDWQTRLIEETNDLRIKVNKLQDFMRTEQFYLLSRVEKDLLYEQFKSMLDYLQILGKRLEIYNLELRFE